MPPRRRVSAPATRVYESGPALQQAKIKSPPRPKKKRIRSYGKRTSVLVPKPKDNTLTQMGFVTDNSPPDLSEEEGDDSEGDYEEAAKKRGTKRRRTMGDQPDSTPSFHTQTISQVVRSFNSNNGLDEEEEEIEMLQIEEQQVHKKQKDIYDVPSSSPQMARGSKPPPRRGRSAGPGKENLQLVAPVREEAIEENVLPGKSPTRSLMPPPQTPHRIRALEIPSSQSPATPLTLPSTQSIRTALSERVGNIPINFGARDTPQDISRTGERQDDPSNTGLGKPNLPPLLSNQPRKLEQSSTPDEVGSAGTEGEKPLEIPLFWNPNPRRNESSPTRIPKLEIKDTFDTTTDTSQITRIPSSPARIRSSPGKSVRFAVPDESPEVQTPVPTAVSEMPESPPPSTRSVKTEILDSDAESEDEDLVDDNEVEDLIGEKYEHKSFVGLLDENCTDEMDVDIPESGETGDINMDESQAGAQGEAQNESGSEEVIIVPESIETDKEAGEEILSSQAHGASPDLGTESDYGDIGAETQFQVEKLTSSSHVSLTPEETNNEEVAFESYEERTQYMETQRLATQYINNMAARTGESDVFISMSGAELTTVLDRTRNHLIRNWKLAPKVCRVWIYETQPVSAVQYMAEISPLKRPGELPEEGIANEGFNTRPANTTYSAYEILQVYELLDPVQLATLLEKGWFEAPPKKWERVAPAVIDELVCNLKPPLFRTQYGEERQTPQSSETETQEVNGQLLSNIQQYTQPVPVLVPEDEVKNEVVDEDQDEDEIQSSPFKLPAPRSRTLLMEERVLPPLSQATTVDLSQTQTPRHNRQKSVEIIMESPSRPTPIDFLSSTPLQLPSHRTPRNSRRGGGGASRTSERDEEQEPESLVPYSMESSQLKLLTKSQLLSESLLQDSVPEPPDWVGDSEEEDYDNDL